MLCFRADDSKYRSPIQALAKAIANGWVLSPRAGLRARNSRMVELAAHLTVPEAISQTPNHLLSTTAISTWPTLALRTAVTARLDLPVRKRDAKASMSGDLPRNNKPYDGPFGYSLKSEEFLMY